MNLRVVHSVRELREQVRSWRLAGERVAFVPTMGNLHAGHYSLIAQARQSCERAVSSVFVNPTQFGPGEDFERYPRTLDADAAGLAAHGCDLLFAPTVEEMYPRGTAQHVQVQVPRLGEVLCGAFRPGHFAGVATVVAKLLGMAQADVAWFGQKDYQQLLVIRRVVADLAIPVEIRGGATVREPDGLAMSSRNQYLNVVERERAATIYQTLQEMARLLAKGWSIVKVESTAAEMLTGAGLRPDYAVVRRADNLEEADSPTVAPLVALIAARLGRARLIDNLLIESH